jgi:hypothetical protein
LAELANNAPSIADAIAGSMPRSRKLRATEMASAGDARALVTPENWVRDYISAAPQSLSRAGRAAETLGGALSDPLSMSEPMRRRLKEAWGIAARVVAAGRARQCQPAL